MLKEGFASLKYLIPFDGNKMKEGLSLLTGLTLGSVVADPDTDTEGYHPRRNLSSASPSR